MIRAILACLILTACVSTPRDKAERLPSDAEAGEEAVKRMQDEFNNLIPNG